MVRIDSSGNFIEDMNTMTTIDKDGNLRYIPMSGNTTQKKKKKDGILDNWLQAPELLEDGFQISDIPKTILGTGADIGLGIVQGIVAGGEGIGDLLSYGASGISRLAGNDELADQLKENAKINATEEIFGVIKNRTGVEKASVIGSKGDQVSNAIGTILTLTSTAGLGGAAGLGKTGQTIVSMGSMGASSVGSGMSEAYQGGATDEEAVKYGLISGAAEVGSEMLFGGLGKGAKAVGIGSGLSSADDMLAKTISDKFKSQLAKNLAQYTVKAGAEGIEEVISGLAQAWGKKMTYMSDEDLGKLIQDENLLDQFIVGFVSSGVSQAPGLVKTTSTGKNFLNGYSQNEQKVYDALLQERIEEAQSESKKPLTKKQINAIEEEFRQDFENGNISTKKIEQVLGYENIYNNLKDKTENALAKTLTAQDEVGIREEAKQEYAKRIKDDEFLKKNYYEDTQRTKAYNVDVNQYDKKYRKTIQKAIDSGILNNSTKTHQFVDFISKLAADKGVTFDFTNNEELKNSSLGIDGATVNGYVNANGDITLNINSAKSLNSVVGHEITHVLEGSELYQALSDSLKEYAETKGEYAKKYNELQELYKNVEGADITKELNADLVGDYLFTNQEFINHLTQNRNLFQRIYDEIKYLVKQATTGSKEQRQLLKAQKMFEQAYRDNKVKMAEQENSENDIKLSISGIKGINNLDDSKFKRGAINNYNEAIEMKKDGESNEKILEETKWFQDKNGDWKYELDDSNVVLDMLKIKENGTFKLKDIFDFPMLYRLYPEFENYTIKFKNMSEKNKGSYSNSTKTIAINNDYIKNSDYKNLKGTILHELQHAIQYYEGFESGATARLSGKAYRESLGEIEAADVKNRYVNQVDRSEIAPLSSQQNPKHPTFDSYMENRTTIDKIKDGIYPFYKDVIDRAKKNQRNLEENSGNSRTLVDGGVKYSLTTDSNGKELSKEQQEYFKDSKVRDENGNLLEVYHGTNYEFNKYKSDYNEYYLTDNEKAANDYGSNIKKEYLNLINPYIVDFEGKNDKANDIYENGIFDVIDYAKENGYDGVIAKNTFDGANTHNQYVAFEPNQIKNVDNTNPTSNEDIRYSLSEETDSKGNNLSIGQQEYFRNSKARDNDGKLITLYHGTPNDFTIFDTKNFGGKNGTAEGFGIYLTDNIDVADDYLQQDKGKVMELYANITKPATTDDLTVNKQDVIKAIKELTTKEAQQMVNDGEHDTIDDALKDTWISNYTYTYDKSIEDSYNDVAKAVLESSENDYEVLQELMNGTGNNDYRRANDFYNIITNTLGFDGIKTKWEFTNNDLKNKNADIWLAFNSNQVKNTDNLNPTENEDIRYSVSKNGEEIAPTGNYNVYGKDIELQQIAPIRQDLVNLQNDIAAIKEDYKKQSEDIKKELQLLRQEREELDRGVNEVAPIDEYTPVESDIAPYESENAYPNTNVVPLDDKLLNKYKKYFKENFYFKGKQLDNAMEGIKELSANPELTQEDVYKYFKENFGKYETQQMNYSINEAKSDLRHMEIGVSDEVKKDIAHRYESYNDFRKKNFGKLILVEYNGQNGVDTRFEELSKQYPDLFDANETINPADQLVALSEIANNKGYDTYFAELNDNEVRAYANEMYSMIKDFRNETNQKLAEEQIPLSYLEEIAPTQEEETIDDYYNNLNERITNLENELENIPKREYYDVYNRELEDRLSERIEPEKRDILDLINLENAKKNGKKVELVKPIVAKEKGTIRSGIDTLKTMFVNANAEIDNLARESGNKMIKIAGDMLNNYSAEAQNDITTAQTDNYGNAIGKSVQQLFEPVKEAGLEVPFNDYLINYSNIDRWARGKGSKTPLNESKRLVANYETKYPQFERWAKDIWKYAENIRNNWLESGMISQNMYKVLSKAYPHYVPYISDTNSFDATMDKIDELKARPIKRAVGGATELFPVEEALTRYTFAQKRAYRTNELYKQIYNSLQTNPGQRGAEVGEGYFNGEEPNLYRNDSGNYITAVIDGEERTIQISDDLFKALRNDMQTQIKDLENRLSLITKPLQTASNIRRKLLTTWNPVFLVKNVVKDIQDGLFNSKHTGGLVLNYLPSIKELITKSTPEVKQYLALSGNEALRGDYETDLYQPKKGLKNNKFLKALSNANEIMEQAPRYAEFKASLEAGDSIEEAMYNSREVTTNFARGGVITKALNRNGFTFLNASVQGFDKFIRNFSGENGARGIANSLLKAVALAVAPAVFNELAFGIGDDKDEEYEALPDYIKDNYYLIKTGDGNFVRIPKGRMLSVFGSAARRTIELAEGEEDAFEGYLSNVNNQIGVNNPEENNIFSPFIQAYGSENGTAWYGGDIVPSRLQDKPKNEQYDASIDKFSIWLSNTELGKKMGLSPYKVNYVLDQYSGGIGDIILPMITDEATSDGGVFAPISDQFVVNSTTDNKYVSEFYNKNDELKVKANSSEATDKDYLRNQYMYGISKEMGKLYAERREIQSNNSLTKEEKYRKSQAIKEQINKFAKYGLESYDDISLTGNYAHVGYDMGYYKNAKGNWTPIDQKDIIATESIGLTDREMSTYYGVKNDMYNIDQEYDAKLKGASDEEKTELNAQKKVDIINSIKNTNLPDNAKAILYDKKYADTDTLNAVLDCKIDFDSYLDLQAQNFTADKDRYGKSISGSKKAKVYGYINSMNMPYEQKIMLAKLEYKSDNTYNNEIINYLNNDPTISYQDMTSILKAMGFKVDEYGNITW